MATTYKTFLRSIGRKPIPPVSKLRTTRRDDSVELAPGGRVIVWRDGKPQPLESRVAPRRCGRI